MNSPCSSIMSSSSQGSEILQGQSGSLYMILTPYSGWQWIVTPSLLRSISSNSSCFSSLPETPVKRKSPPRAIIKLKRRKLAETTSDLPEQLELFSDSSTIVQEEDSRESWPVKNEFAWLQIEPLEEEVDFNCSEQLPEKRCESPGLEGFVLE